MTENLAKDSVFSGYNGQIPSGDPLSSQHLQARNIKSSTQRSTGPN